MRETQLVAMDLFVERGFDAVTVDEIARTIGVAASTVYRHFGTKEGIVLWDEHDAAIDEALAAALQRQPPLRAIRDAFYADDGPGNYLDPAVHHKDKQMNCG